MTQPPEDQGSQAPPPLQPFGQPPGYGQPGSAPPPGYGQPGYGAPPPGYGLPGYGQPPGGYQPYPGPPRPMPPPGHDPALAQWWQRLVARLIDAVVLIVIIGPLWLAALIPAWHRLQTLSTESPYLSPAAQHAFNASLNRAITHMFLSFLLVGLAGGVIGFGYDWLQHGLWGQTIGKRAMGTKVVSADTRGRISGGAACGRAAVYMLIPLVPTVGGIFGLLDTLWLLWDPQRQCLHDKAARTVVVKADLVPDAAPAQPNMSR